MKKKKKLFQIISKNKRQSTMKYVNFFTLSTNLLYLLSLAYFNILLQNLIRRKSQ